MGMWSQSWQLLPVDSVDWLLVFSSELESELWVCDSEEDGLVSVDVLIEGDESPGCVSVSSSVVVCMVPFSATRCVNN